jgi:hypothetical protein
VKFLYFVLLLCLNVFSSDGTTTINNHNITGKEHILLDSISNYAVRIGTGTINNIYVFVDPMCPHSRKFISKISKNKMIQLENSYYIFLYRLPKFESDELIQCIYQSSDVKSSLMDVMVNGKEINMDSTELGDNKLKAIKEISSVGKKLNIKIRPYLMIFEDGSKYCRVSKGIAPCMEEFDLE